MRSFLFLVTVLASASQVLAEVCFVRKESTASRDIVTVVASSSQLHCNIQCLETPGCEACMFHASRAKCSLLEAARGTPTGSCPARYTCYEKQLSGCPFNGPPAVDFNYTSSICSKDTDITGPPIAKAKLVCGNPMPVGEKRIVLDAILHDGSRTVFENNQASFVDWDPFIASWYFDLSGDRYYFKCATCVRAPAIFKPPAVGAHPSCVCSPLTIESPLLPGLVPDRNGNVTVESMPICPGRVQVHFKRGRFNGASVLVQTNAPNPRGVYCTLGQWMSVMEQPTFNQYTVVAMTCVYP